MVVIWGIEGRIYRALKPFFNGDEDALDGIIADLIDEIMDEIVTSTN